MSDGESVHSSAILSKAATGGRRGLKLNKRTQNNIYFQVLIRTSSGISISRKSTFKLVNSRNFEDVCMVGDTNLPSIIQTSGEFLDFTELSLRFYSTNNSQARQLYWFRRYLQRCRRIFANWPRSKLKKTVEWCNG